MRVIPDPGAFVCIPTAVVHVHTASSADAAGKAGAGKQAWVVDEDTCSFQTQIFRIRYCFEEASAGSLCGMDERKTGGECTAPVRVLLRTLP